jgi:acyl-CoA reductase-like NAD-dependent aldehyde dehydrogenase
LAEKSIKPALLARLTAAIESFYAADPKTSPDFGRIVNDHHFERLVALLGDGNVVTGGIADAEQRYVAPTIIDGVSWDDAIMQEEIFGPILPVLDFDDLETVMAALEVKPKPLALYFFSENRDRQEQALRRVSSGGAASTTRLRSFSTCVCPLEAWGRAAWARITAGPALRPSPTTRAW